MTGVVASWLYVVRVNVGRLLYRGDLFSQIIDLYIQKKNELSEEHIKKNFMV